MTDLFFDMDDTLTNTNEYLYRITLSHFNLTKQHREFDVLKECRKNGLTTLQLPSMLGEYIGKHFVGPGHFMLGVFPSPMLLGKLDQFKDLVGVVRKQGGSVGVCTHRGLNDHAEAFTTSWLEDNGLLPYIDQLYVINPKQHPNKINFLKTKSKKFKLVDDNPLHDLNTVHDHHPDILHYTGISRYDAYRKQYQVNEFSDIQKHFI